MISLEGEELLSGLSFRRNNTIVDLRFFRPTPPLSFCLKHRRIWPEGDLFRKEGGKACKECCLV